MFEPDYTILQYTLKSEDLFDDIIPEFTYGQDMPTHRLLKVPVSRLFNRINQTPGVCSIQIKKAVEPGESLVLFQVHEATGNLVTWIDALMHGRSEPAYAFPDGSHADPAFFAEAESGDADVEVAGGIFKKSDFDEQLGANKDNADPDGGGRYGPHFRGPMDHAATQGPKSRLVGLREDSPGFTA